MKFTAALISLVAMVSTASANMSISGKNAEHVLRAARRLGNNNNNNNNNNEYAYLEKYTLKMVSCKAGETVTDPQDGATEYNAVVFRLCPTESGCSNDYAKGCKSGYGDFVVGLDTFVNAYFEDQKDNMQWDDNFKVDEYAAECRQYKPDNNNNNNNNNNQAYYIGPTCTSDGTNVRLAVFDEDTCQQESSTSFETLSNGWSLPFSSGGLVSNECINCIDANNGDQLRQMCLTVYEDSADKCETNMQYYSYYGQNTQGCDTVSQLMPVEKKSHKGGKVFGWIVFVFVVVGLAGYVVWWRKKKSGSSSDGLMA